MFAQPLRSCALDSEAIPESQKKQKHAQLGYSQAVRLGQTLLS
jgi:hypothetical protein